MKPIQWIGLVALLLIAGCSPKVFVQKDNTVDFTKFKTYTWVDGDADKDSLTNRSNANSLRDQKVHASVEKYLQELGWTLTNTNPDVFLVYDVVIEKENVNVSTPVYSQPMTRYFYNPGGRRWVPIFYPSNFMGYSNSTQTIREGTLTLTMMNPENDKTIWQGWTTSEIYGKKITDKDIDKYVKAIISKLKTP
jgi:hypothetical protein